MPQGHSWARLGLLWDSSWQCRPLQACVHPEHYPSGPLETQVTCLQPHFLALALGLCLCLRTSVGHQASPSQRPHNTCLLPLVPESLP